MRTEKDYVNHFCWCVVSGGGVVIVFYRESVKILGDYKENKRKCDAKISQNK